MKNILTTLLLVSYLGFAGAAVSLDHAGRKCSPKGKCTACKNCTGCKNCAKNGGRCSVCK